MRADHYRTQHGVAQTMPRTVQNDTSYFENNKKT